jgi:hypothetical protein
MSDGRQEWEANETPDLDEDKLWRDGVGPYRAEELAEK